MTEAQYRQLQQRGYLEVPSPSMADCVYRIPGAGGMVRVYEHGYPLMDLYLQPAEPLPEADVVLLHTLLLTANEQEYLQQANQFAPRTIPLHTLRWEDGLPAPTARETTRFSRLV